MIDMHLVFNSCSSILYLPKYIEFHIKSVPEKFSNGHTSPKEPPQETTWATKTNRLPYLKYYS